MPKYLISPEAIADLREVFDHMAADSQAAADRLEVQLRSAIRFLADWPDAGRERPELGKPPLRFWPSGNFLIVYRKHKQKIEIAAVLHAARDVPAVLDKRATP